MRQTEEYLSDTSKLLLRPHKLKYYVDTMASRNISAAQTLRGTGLSEASLATPNRLVNIKQYETVIENMLDATGNSALGLEIGNNATLADYGELSVAMMSAQNLRQAASDWPKLCFLFGMFITYDFQEEVHGWRITTINCDRLTGRALCFALEEFLLIHFRIAEALTGQKPEIAELAFAYPPPPHAWQYQQYFSCGVEFNAPHHSATVLAPDLDTPIRSSDPYLHELIHRRCSEIIRHVSSQGAVVPRLRSLFLARSGALPTQDEASAYLGMSTRSLRRRLLEENSSFQKIVDETRFELAHQYLVCEGLTAKQTAYLLGYRTVTAFRKSFKCWSDRTINDYLKTIGQDNRESQR